MPRQFSNEGGGGDLVSDQHNHGTVAQFSNADLLQASDHNCFQPYHAARCALVGTVRYYEGNFRCPFSYADDRPAFYLEHLF